MKITSEEIKYVADLARLQLSAAEIDAMATQLGRILNYVEKLNELDTGGVAATSHALSITNAFRDDEVRQSLDREEGLANAPQQDGESFVVPKVIK